MAHAGCVFVASIQPSRTFEDLFCPAMECMCAQTRPRFIIIIIIIIIIIAFKGAIQDFLQSPHSAVNCLQHVRSSGPGTWNTSSAYTLIRKSFWGMESKPMLTPSEKSLLLDAHRRIKPMMLHNAGQRTQHTTGRAIPTQSWPATCQYDLDTRRRRRRSLLLLLLMMITCQYDLDTRRRRRRSLLLLLLMMMTNEQVHISAYKSPTWCNQKCKAYSIQAGQNKLC